VFAYVLQAWTLEIGETYRLQFMTHGNGTNAARYRIRDATAGVDVVALGTTGITGTGWQRFSAEFVVPAGCTSLQITLADGGAGTVYFDNVSLQKKSRTGFQSTLEHYNDIAMHIGGVNPSADTNTYLYGRALPPTWSARVYRKLLTGQTLIERGLVSTVDPAYLVHNVLTTTTNDLIFVVATKTLSTNEHYLLRSTDGGATFAQVMAFGAANGAEGADSKNVRLLTNESFLEITHTYPGGGGVGDLYIGEYNVAPDRVSGGQSDRVRLMKSTDSGATWTAVMNWNTSGHQIRHIHALKQDQFTGYVYICTGDGDSESAIIRWDGASAWTDNSAPSVIAGWSGFAVASGTQHHRTVGIIITSGYVFTGADNDRRNASYLTDSGIWRWAKDLSGGTRVDDDIISYDPMHCIWSGGKINNTLYFRTCRQAATGYEWTEQHGLIYASDDNGTTWYRAALEMYEADETHLYVPIPVSTFTYSNHLFIDSLDGLDFASSTELYISGQTTEEGSTTRPMHPVYYVGTWNAAGNDSNDGRSPDAPCATLAGVLAKPASSGARVRTSGASDYIVP
jgi:hypothetical protein